jgi:hypothetical protein
VFYNDIKKLNALDVIAIEDKILKKIEYKNIIEDFILKNTKKIVLSK